MRKRGRGSPVWWPLGLLSIFNLVGQSYDARRIKWENVLFFLFLFWNFPFDNPTSDFGFNLVKLLAVFCTTSVSRRVGERAGDRKTKTRDVKEVIVTLSISPYLYFWQRPLDSIGQLLVVTAGQYFALTFFIPPPLLLCKCREWLLDAFHLPIHDAHTKDEEMKERKKKAASRRWNFGAWKEMEFWLGEGKECYISIDFFLSFFKKTPSMTGGLLK